MKRILFVFILTGIIFSACTQEVVKPFDGDIQFDTITISCVGSGELDKNYTVKLNYLNPIDGPDYLKDSINRTTLKFMSRWLRVADLSALKIAVDKHKEAFDSLPAKTEFGQYQAFNLNINPTSIFQNKQVISYAYDWYVFEGGAHGASARWCLMFDKKDGTCISYQQLIKNEPALLELAKKYFCEEHGINEKDLYSSYSFKDNKFYLSEHFLFSDKHGLSFYYYPYEIAPYVAGLIEVNLPFEEIKEYINYLD